MGRKNKPLETKQYIISGEDSARIQILKLWFIILVIFIHAYTEEVHFSDGDLVLQVPTWLAFIKYTISRVIARCAVPGFFFLSSVLLFRREFTWLENIKKKIKTLILPWFILTTFWIIVIFVAQHIASLSGFIHEDSFYNVADWTALDFVNAYLGLEAPDYNPLVYPLWFMRDLVVLNAVSILLKKLIDRLPRLVLFGLAILIILDINTIWFLSTQAICFFCLGYYVVKFDFHFSDIDKLAALPLFVLYIGSVIVDSLLRGAQFQYLARIVSIILGLLFFMRFTTQIRTAVWKSRILNIAKYSVSIYLFHELFLTFFKKSAVRLLPTGVFFQVLTYIGIPAVVIIFCILFSICMKKYVPKIYSVLTGRRNL